MFLRTISTKAVALFILFHAHATLVGTSEEMARVSSVCPNGTTPRSNATIYGLDVEVYWYPWLRKVFPSCWAALEPLICLDTNNNNGLSRRQEQVVISTPCQHLCHVAQTSCWMLDQFRHNISLETSGDVLNCSQYVGVHSCNLNTTIPTQPVCGGPLHDSYEHQDAEVVRNKLGPVGRNNTPTGCSLLCNSKLSVHHPQDENITFPVVVGCCVGFVLSLFTMVTFLVDWKCQNRYPALILFILNCLFVTCLFGWILQFLGVGNLVRCSPGNYRRLQEPRYRSTSWCLVSFILIYFSSMAIGCWYVILTYSWYISFKALGSTKNSINGKVRYFHITAWSIALLLTGIVLFLGEVDGHEFTNVCFVGYHTKSVRVVFVYTPLVVCLILGEVFLVCSVLVLWKVHADCRLFIVPRATTNIVHTVHRLAVYAVVMFLVVALPIVCCIHEDYTSKEWLEHYNSYLRCMIVRTNVPKYPYYGTCKKPDERKLVYFYIELGCLFLGCVATNSWTWTSATGRIWINYWKRWSSIDTPTQLQISWYHRMQKKKIAPFVPPLDPGNPLETVLTRRPSELFAASGLHPMQNINLEVNGQVRRHSEDIRSVFELFSARRGTKGSIESEPNQRLPVPLGGLNRSQSVASLQNYGHLAYGNFNYNTEHNLLRKLSSTNFTTAQVRNVDHRCSSNLTVTHLKNIHDNLLTPISLAHRNSIVADCIPYPFMHKVPMAQGKLVNQSVDPSLNLNQGMEPCSITSTDQVS